MIISKSVIIDYIRLSLGQSMLKLISDYHGNLRSENSDISLSEKVDVSSQSRRTLSSLVERIFTLNLIKMLF